MSSRWSYSVCFPKPPGGSLAPGKIRHPRRRTTPSGPGQNHQKPPHKTGKKIAQESGEILKTNHFSLHLSIVKRKDSRQFCEKSSSRAGCKDGCQGFREGFLFCVLCAALCECVLFYFFSRLSSKLEMDTVFPSFSPLKPVILPMLGEWRKPSGGAPKSWEM